MQATKIVYWPGNTVYACDIHAATLKRMSVELGFALSVVPCTKDELCINCVNEAKEIRDV